MLPKTPDNPDGVKEAQLIPVAVGLIGADGKDLVVDVAGVAVSGEEGGSGAAFVCRARSSSRSRLLRFFCCLLGFARLSDSSSLSSDDSSLLPPLSLGCSRRRLRVRRR